MLNVKLNRKPSPDSRDEKYQIHKKWPHTLMQAATNPALTQKMWDDNWWWGNQGATPQCVGYAWAHCLADAPIIHSQNPAMAPEAIYEAAQKLDEWPGEDYAGTSVRGGVKALQAAKWVSNYYWTWSVNTMVATVLSVGPVVVGSDWLSGMMTPTKGAAMIYARGRVLGGHAYVVNGVDTVKKVFRIKNSWGQDWGQGGHAWISIADMAKLIRDSGEVCIATELTDQQHAAALQALNS